MQIDLFDGKPQGTQTVASGDLELYRVDDGRFLVHMTLRDAKHVWIELSSDQANWLAGQLSKS